MFHCRGWDKEHECIVSWSEILHGGLEAHYQQSFHKEDWSVRVPKLLGFIELIDKWKKKLKMFLKKSSKRTCMTATLACDRGRHKQRITSCKSDRQNVKNEDDTCINETGNCWRTCIPCQWTSLSSSSINCKRWRYRWQKEKEEDLVVFFFFFFGSLANKPCVICWWI